MAVKSKGHNTINKMSNALEIKRGITQIVAVKTNAYLYNGIFDMRTTRMKNRTGLVYGNIIHKNCREFFFKTVFTFWCFVIFYSSYFCYIF